jgi:protein-L-isoaspartate(D-aspartate) O-methyltransferase
MRVGRLARTFRWLSLGLACALLAAVHPAAGQRRDGQIFRQWRHLMVEEQLRRRGISQSELLQAMSEVPREQFVPEELRAEAYKDRSLPIGWGEFLQRPYLSAHMIELLDLESGDKVLEVGTGSGYDAAVMSQLAGEIYTIEIIETLGEAAKLRMTELGYRNVAVKVGDGYRGWPEHAPFDAIILTAAPPEIPQQLLDQLKTGGRMVLPVGGVIQDLILITKEEDGIRRRRIEPVVLGPMKEGQGG